MTTTTCADCHQPIHRITEPCPDCGYAMWGHDTAMAAFGCPGDRDHIHPAQVVTA